MLWWLLAGLFGLLAVRELHHGFSPPPGMGRPAPVAAICTAMVLGSIAAAFAYMPVSYRIFERNLSDKASLLSGKDDVQVHCNTLADSLFSPDSLAAGYAEIKAGRIYFQYPYCARLMDHLKHPQTLSKEELFSMQIFVHEVMHIRGEYNEVVAECQALQRYARASMLLGVPKDVALGNGTSYFRDYYQQRAQSGEFSARYYSAECAPGKALDEGLPEMVW